MSEAPEPIEDLAAGVLNGVMILAIGCVCPIVLFGQMAFRWGVSSFDLGLDTRSDFFALGLLSFGSLGLIRTGFGVARQNLLALLRRRRSTAAV